LGELRIYDLLRDGDRPLLWGVYFFYSPDRQCLYVGKNSARKFVERIPAHLSLAPTSWMSHLVKRICKHEGIGSLAEAAESARCHRLLLMPVNRREQIGEIGRLERFFRLFADPRYNSLQRRSRHSLLDLGAPLMQVLEYV
jgi:hypothetical protein